MAGVVAGEKNGARRGVGRASGVKAGETGPFGGQAVEIGRMGAGPAVTAQVAGREVIR